MEDQQRFRDESRQRRSLQHQEDMARIRAIQDDQARREDRERDQVRESNERAFTHQQPSATPRHSSSAGSLPIHQPQANRISGAIHSPGGLLANHNGAPPPPASASVPIGGPVANFGGPLQQQAGERGPLGTGPLQQQQQHQMFAPMGQTAGGAPAVFGGPLTQQQPSSQQQIAENQRGGQQPNAPFRGVTPSGHQIPGGITQGQQPILNVSLFFSYFLPIVPYRHLVEISLCWLLRVNQGQLTLKWL